MAALRAGATRRSELTAHSFTNPLRTATIAACVRSPMPIFCSIWLT